MPPTRCRRTRFCALIAAATACLAAAGPLRAQQCIPGWTNVSNTGPAARYLHAMAYDSMRGAVVSFGGYTTTPSNMYFADTWLYGVSGWQQASPANAPAARGGHAMAFDSTRNVAVMNGGWGAGTFSDTWEWNGTNWTQQVASGPPKLRLHAMAYDSNRHVIVMFGGYNSTVGAFSNEVWEWNGTAWTHPNPSVRPTPRMGPSMAYDSRRHVCVMFGGYEFAGDDGDTWEWNGTTWTQRITGYDPAARSYAAMAFDPLRGVTVLFAGEVAAQSLPLSDVWEWDGSAWAFEPVSPSPAARYQFAMAYDASLSRCLAFAGRNVTPGAAGLFHDTWTYGADLLPGDLDSDCAVTSADAQLLVTELLGQPFSPGVTLRADINHDGRVDGADIKPFVALLLNGV